MDLVEVQYTLLRTIKTKKDVNCNSMNSANLLLLLKHYEFMTWKFMSAKSINLQLCSNLQIYNNNTLLHSSTPMLGFLTK